MLTLTNSLSVEGYTVFQDDTNSLEPVQPGSALPPLRFYVLPEKPAIALDNAGQPVFSLVVYRQDEDRIAPADATKDVGGGILTFTVSLDVPDQKLNAIRKKLATRFYGDSTDPNQPIDVTMVSFLDGSVSVAVAGETGDAGSGDHEFVKGAVGTGKVSGIGGNSKAVMVKLSQAGASLMSQLQQLKTLPINVQYDLTFEHRLMGVTMHVWCDINSSYTLIQETLHTTDEYHDGYLGVSHNHVDVDKITSVTEIMTRNKTAGVEVVPATSQVDADTLTSLEKMGLDMLNQEMQKAIEATPPPKELDRTYLTDYISTIGNNFNFTLDRQMVLVQAFRPSANISNVFQQGKFDDLVAFIDLRDAFFSLLKVPVRVNADFKTLPVDSVVVTVTYTRQRVGGGGREVATDSFQFTDGATIQSFLTFANTLADVAYDWQATVHYRGSTEPYTFSQRGEKENFLVVDVGTMGMIQVDLGLGLVNLDSYPTCNVSFRYNSAALGRAIEREFKLDKNEQTAMWAEPVYENPTNGYEYKVDWLRKDGAILPGKWTRTTSSRLRVDEPTVDQLKVSVMCSGNFKDATGDQISQIGVSLVYRDPANHYTQEGELTFTDEKVTQVWAVDLRNPDLRDYEYRYSIIYKDGLVKQVPADGSSLPGQPGFITVGENYLVKVDLFPSLLTYPDWAKIAQIDFTYKDPEHDISENDSFVFTTGDTAKKTWRVRGATGGPKTYTYQIKYFSTTGTVTSLDPVTQAAEVIVIPPLAAAKAQPGG